MTIIIISGFVGGQNVLLINFIFILPCIVSARFSVDKFLSSLKGCSCAPLCI